ncbi:helix-turn-helix domain-containing protein [Amycolatopsis dendrobii]|uniref:Peptidase inhibitor family I36 protein n=1 Tax=Amycolatopsis dendrobii TaxID=2760662 RepID=A0A7W3VSQ4_9PSEU|nr:helix-turn-helix transcriptional regulator [Amycolatopsis dendrobii]MBB1152122.1 peptidase inhibitor family I36 protein [Amycolatopsis dendrobii]
MAERGSDAKTFGERLRELRGPITQHALARRSAIGSEALTRQRVSYLENGQVPTAGQLRCYLRGCDRADLFDELDAVRKRLCESGPASGEPAGPGRRWQFAAIGALAAAVLLAAATATFWALDRPSATVAECAPGFVCFWSEPEFGGHKITLDPVWASANHCAALPFEARSEMNSSKERQLGFPAPDCTGWHTVLNHLGGTERSTSVRSYRHS